MHDGNIVPERRLFLAGAGSLAGTLLLPRAGRAAAGKTQPVVLEARPGSARLLETSQMRTGIWGYDGSVPGPVLRTRQGSRLWVRLKNSLEQPTTIHWHGIRIENAMDGVAGLTQKPVPPGETFDYRFTVPDAGTFWYHPHNRSWEQVARGLYGALIVEEPDAPEVDQDIVVIADDWLIAKGGELDEKSFGSVRERAHAGRLGNILTLNGKPEGTFQVSSGERIRLRLLNTCNARILRLRFEQLSPHVIALDGQPVAPYPLENEIIKLAPAQRADLLVDMTGAPGSKSAITEVSQSRLVAGSFIYHPVKKAPRRTNVPRLPDNNLIEAGDANLRKVDLVMTGGAMGRIEKAVYKGKDYAIRDLVRDHGMMWAFNGVAGMPGEPLFTASRGEGVAIWMVNDTRWPHAMHFHGHHFREAGGPWRDTILIDAGKTKTVSFVADNPGKWMIHCHMLEHQAGGMATWFAIV